MKTNLLPDLEKCKKCGDTIEVGSECMSCIYFETNYPGVDISEIVHEVGNDVSKSTTKLISASRVTSNTRLTDLEGDTEGILGLSIPGVNGTVVLKYKIYLSKGFSSSGDDLIPIEKIELQFNRGVPEETRKLTRPFKDEIEQIVRKAYYGEN